MTEIFMGTSRISGITEAGSDPGTPADMLTGRIEAIAARLDQVVAQRKELEDEEKFLRTRLASLCPLGETTQAGPFSVSVRENRRFDATLAKQVLTADELRLCIVSDVVAAKAKAALPPERYAACQAPTGDPVVRVTS